MTALKKITYNTVLKLTDTDLISFQVFLCSICLVYNSASIVGFAMFFLSLVVPVCITELTFDNSLD